MEYGLFMPAKLRQCHKRDTYARCRWCGKRNAHKHMYKLRDGPMDWWFCSDDHALEWLDYRHVTPVIYAMLKKPPCQRDLGGKSIEDWVRDEVSHNRLQECDHSQS